MIRLDLSGSRPLIFTLGMFCAAFAFLYLRSHGLNGGELVYILDDPYIHMAMARHLVEHGILGVTPYEFSFSTSSPLWTSLLAVLYSLAGVKDVIPLLVNFIVCVISIFWLHRTFCRAGVTGTREAVVLPVLVFCTSFLTLSFTGMEHSLHVLLTLVFIWRMARATGEVDRPAGALAADFSLAAALVMTRYEGLFLIAPAALILFVRRHPRRAVAVALGAALPVTALGIWSLSNGWNFFPSSLLLKANLPALSLFGTAKKMLAFYYLLGQCPDLLVLIIAALLVLLISWREPEYGNLRRLAIMFVVAAVLHLQFAQVNLLRYESYLVTLGLFTLGISLPMMEKILRKYGLFTRGAAGILIPMFVLLFALSPLVLRAARAFTWVPRGSRNIHEQQRQMAHFLKMFYSGEAVAANDIGAINYYADLHCLDLWGLGNREVLAARRAGLFDPEFADSLSRTRGVKAALLYEAWFDPTGGLPEPWVQVGWWKIRDNIVCGDTKVTFYAVDPSHAETLADRLRRFDPFLPERIIRGGEYTVRPAGAVGFP